MRYTFAVGGGENIRNNAPREVDMTKKITLLVMAAGMGSRFGGLKQIEPFGPNGETILDYSVCDAAKAGFGRAVIVLRRSMLSDFRETVGRRIEKLIDVRYALQENDLIPSGFSVPAERTRPLGTAHAVWCAREHLDAPFAVVNSDDFYGGASYLALADALTSPDLSACMVGYRLGNTLSETGTVNRGICTVKDGLLTGIEERCGIDKNSGVPLDTVVSMNMWGFRPDFVARLDSELRAFLPAMKDPLKDELYLPGVVDGAIKDGSLSVRVLDTPEKWYGVTYREDAAALRAAIAGMIAAGKYRV